MEKKWLKSTEWFTTWLYCFTAYFLASVFCVVVKVLKTRFAPHKDQRSSRLYLRPSNSSSLTVLDCSSWWGVQRTFGFGKLSWKKNLKILMSKSIWTYVVARLGGDDEQGKLARAITPSKLTFSPSFGPSQFSIRKVHTCKLHATFELVSNLLKGENWSHLMSTSC